mgnify:CR=1 FL=1
MIPWLYTGSLQVEIINTSDEWTSCPGIMFNLFQCYALLRIQYGSPSSSNQNLEII